MSSAVSMRGVMWLLRELRPRTRVLLSVVLAALMLVIALAVTSQPGGAIAFALIALLAGFTIWARKDASIVPIAAGAVLSGLGAAIVVPPDTELIWILPVAGFLILGASLGSTTRTIRLHRIPLATHTHSQRPIVTWQYRSDGRWLRVRNRRHEIADPTPTRLRDIYDRLDGINSWALTLTNGTTRLDIVCNQPGDVGLYRAHDGSWDTLIPTTAPRATGNGAWTSRAAWPVVNALATGTPRPHQIITAPGRQPYPRIALRELQRNGHHTPRTWRDTIAAMRGINTSSRAPIAASPPPHTTHTQSPAVTHLETATYQARHATIEKRDRRSALLIPVLLLGGTALILLVPTIREDFAIAGVLLVSIVWGSIGLTAAILSMIRRRYWNQFLRSAPGENHVVIAVERMLRSSGRIDSPKGYAHYRVVTFGRVTSSTYPGIDTGTSLKVVFSPDAAPDIHRQGIHELHLSIAYGTRHGRAWANGIINDLWWPVTFAKTQHIDTREHVRYAPYTPEFVER